MSLMQEFKGKLLNVKTRIAMLSMAAFFMVMNSSYASGAGSFDTSSVTDTFVKIGVAILAIIAAVALTAAGVMVAIMGWRFGKKMFGIIAK